MTDEGFVNDPQGYFDQDMDEPELCRMVVGSCAVFSRRCPEKQPNEDAAVLIPAGDKAAVLAVADGCGGMAAGEQAARLAIKSLTKSVTDAADDNLRAAILDGIEQANRAVRNLGTGAATTISIVEITEQVIRPYHVGDSLILLVGNHGKIKLQTKSHSPVGYAVAAGVLDETEAIHHDERHVVLNVVGSEDTHIEVGPHRRLARRDTLLIASDGLADNLHIDEIVNIIRKGPLRQAAQALVATAIKRMEQAFDETPSKPDDLTFIAFRRY